MTKVGIVAPAGKVLDEKLIYRCCQFFDTQNWDVSLGLSVVESNQRFAAKNDQERLREFCDFATREDIDLVLAARGGYGMNRLLSGIDYQAIFNRRGLICGFSDITAFSLAYLAQSQGKSFQGPVATTLGRHTTTAYSFQKFLEAITSSSYEINFVARGGEIETQGVLWGGNLSVLCSLIGTPYFPDVHGGILFLEDVHEPAYKIERNLMQLVHTGVLNRQSALLLGDFSNVKAASNDFGYGLKDAFDRIRQEVSIPLIEGLPFGHTGTMCTLTVGAMARLFVKQGKATVTVLDNPHIKR